MICHFCNHEAAAKCVSCGLAICPEHGDRYCKVCSGAVFSREVMTGERAERGYLQCPIKPPMETIYLDDDGPPECYRCHGLARQVCQICHRIYCKDHAAKGNMCDACAKSARLGTWIALAILAVVSGMSVLFCLLSLKP
jgi:hypothetical protein